MYRKSVLLEQKEMNIHIDFVIANALSELFANEHCRTIAS